MTKKIRKPGELQELVGSYLLKSPNAGPLEIAEALAISSANARNALRRLRANEGKTKSVALREAVRQSVAKTGSALDRLMNTSAKAREKKPAREKNNLDEQRFVGILSLIGLSRAEELIANERRKIQQLLKGAST